MNRKKLVEIAFKRFSALSLANPEYKKWVKRFTFDILDQDRGDGDLTSNALFGAKVKPSTALIQTKEPDHRGMWVHFDYPLAIASETV